MKKQNDSKAFDILYKNILKLNRKFSGDFSWDNFCKLFIQGEGPYEFVYNDIIIKAFGPSFGNILTLENKQGVYMKKEFDNPQDLLNSSIINGKKLKDVWHDLQ